MSLTTVSWADRVRIVRDRRRKYRQTFSELSSLTDRELADISISRSEIRRIAREAAGML